ncbi:MAG: hypothetical protein J6V25_07225 [Oscillospiraceae bacterium]|nr:hypothetical protein [Oscillospiraceae bacterium]
MKQTYFVTVKTVAEKNATVTMSWICLRNRQGMNTLVGTMKQTRILWTSLRKELTFQGQMLLLDEDNVAYFDEPNLFDDYIFRYTKPGTGKERPVALFHNLFRADAVYYLECVDSGSAGMYPVRISEEISTVFDSVYHIRGDCLVYPALAECRSVKNGKIIRFHREVPQNLCMAILMTLL